MLGVRGPGAICADRAPDHWLPAATPAIAGAATVLAAWEYEGAARSLVLDLKLRGLKGAAGPLVGAMVTEVRAAGLLGSVVTWVPGRKPRHPTARLRSCCRARGGSGAGVGVPARGQRSRAERILADQTTLGAGERRTNVAGAFAATGCAEKIVLVDDLITTGATAAECVKVLRAFSPSVEVVVPCARGR